MRMLILIAVLLNLSAFCFADSTIVKDDEVITVTETGGGNAIVVNGSKGEVAVVFGDGK